MYACLHVLCAKQAIHLLDLLVVFASILSCCFLGLALAVGGRFSVILRIECRTMEFFYLFIIQNEPLVVPANSLLQHAF